MENDPRSLSPQFPDPYMPGFSSHKDGPNVCPGFRNPLPVEDFSLLSVPFFSASSLHQFKTGVANNSTNWFDHTPHPHRPFAPLLNSSDNGPSLRNGGKRFLVFDQCGGKTTMILTSGPIGVPNDHTPFGSKTQGPRTDDFDRISPLMDDEDVNDYSKDVPEDEMHEEDTEELNALLFSDSDEYDGDEDEEASTGHSPSTMTTDDCVLNSVDEAGEEVDSFARPAKRRKLSSGDHLTKSKCDGKGSSHETYGCSALEDDAELSCGDRSKKQNMRGLGSVSSCKKSRKGKLLEAASVLRSIIPGSNGKDTLEVIDEAVRYLKTLKVEAEALGLARL